jgi:hypothetical protein
MKTTIIKRDTLTNYQASIWDAVTSSPHSLDTICKRSGYSYQSFKNWMRGVYEPKQFAFDSIIQCINIMESEPPKSIDWKTRKSELVSMKLKGMTNKAISLRMNTTRIAIERASKRFGV